MTDTSLLPTVHSSLLAARTQIDNAIAAVEGAVTVRKLAEFDEMRGALFQLTTVINSAGLHNLSAGVQLGPTVWYVKASDAMERASAALAKAEGCP